MKVLIESINQVVPKNGTNAGKIMFVINGKLWSRIEPKTSDTHVITEEVVVPDKGTFTNVVGFTSDTRMAITDKISLLTQYDPSYNQGIAYLLK